MPMYIRCIVNADLPIITIRTTIPTWKTVPILDFEYRLTLCISCNMGTRDLPDMYAQKPEGRRPEG